MAALNPISHEVPAKAAAVLAIDPATRGEERLKKLLYLWLRRYFSGVAFQTRAAGGGSETRTFTDCTFAMQEDKIPENPQKPLIHVVMPERRTRRMDHDKDHRGHDDDWTLDIMIKVPSNLSNTAMNGISAEDIVCKVAGELEWLLCSTEREALSEHGVTRTRLARPSIVLPAGSWQMRMLVMNCRTRRDQAKAAF